MATELERLIVRIEADTERMRRELRQAGASVNRMERTTSRSMARIDGAFVNARKAALRYAGVLVAAFAGRAAVQLVRNAVDQASALQDTADKLGLNVEALQAYRFAAEQTGVASNTLDMALQRFVRRLGEAQAGTGEMLPVIEQYDIALSNADGTMRSAEEVLRDYADTIADAGSAQERLRLAFKAFDSEGAALVNLMREGSAGLDEYMRRARDLGIVLDERVTRRLKQVGDALNVVDQQMRAANARIAMSAMPLIEGYGVLWSNLAVEISAAAGRIASALQMLGVIDDPLVESANNVIALRNELAELEANVTRGREAGLTDEALTRTGDLDRLEELRTQLAEAEAELRALMTARDEFYNSLGTNVPGTDALATEMETLADKTSAARLEANLLTAGMSEQEIAIRLALHSAGLLGENGEYLAEVTREQRDQAEAYAEALRDQADAEIAAEKAAASRGTKAAELVELLADKNAKVAAQANQAVTEEERLADAATEFGLAATSAFEDAIVNGEGFRDVLSGLLEDLSRLILRLTVTQPLMDAVSQGLNTGGGSKSGGFLSGLFSSGGGSGGFLSSLFSSGGSAAVGSATASSAFAVAPMPFAAHGAALEAMRPSVVGEQGPEIFVPKMPGRVLSRPEAMRAVGGGGGGVTISIPIDARGAEPGVEARIDAVLARRVPAILEAAVSKTIDERERSTSMAEAFS